MGAFTKKSGTVDAVLWTGANVEEVNAFFGDDLQDELRENQTIILEGDGYDHVCKVGDWLVRESFGTIYCYNSAEFALLFEPA